jgi:hypothetical protein
MHPLPPLLALSGLGEAEEAFALMIGWSALIAIGIAAAIAIWKTSWIAVSIAAIISLLATALFLPWHAFAPLTPQDIQDPDIRSWAESWREFAVGWFAALALVLACLIVVTCRRCRRGTSRTSRGCAPSAG